MNCLEMVLLKILREKLDKRLIDNKMRDIDQI